MLSKNELKFIKSLKIKKYRLLENRFLVEGAKNVQELMGSDFEIELILCTEFFLSKGFLNEGEYRVEVVSERDLSASGNFVSNKECLAVVQSIKHDKSNIDWSRQVFMLDGINDPGNLGTIIRTLDWFGFNQLICSPDTAELYNPKVVASTMGSFTRVKVWYQELIPLIRASGLTVYGAEMDGENLFGIKLQSPSVILMGSESNGITLPLRDHIVQSITIPKYGESESLNVGVATGIIASHLRME